MKKIYLCAAICAVVFITTLSSCSRNLRFVNSAVVPAAEGKVKINKDDNNNYAVSVKITNLADPERLQPKREMYVVWIDTKDSGIKNIGQLKSSSGFFSSTLEGELTTVTPFYPTRVFITAEDKANVQYPGSITVLTTEQSN